MIKRPEIVKKLMSFREKRLIKIVTGVRRSGKSTIFRLYQEALIKTGVSPSQIITINFEDPDFLGLLEWQALYDHINARLLKRKMNYIFLDEVQNVHDFQRACDGLFIKENVDLYLTGSNSKMQAGQWATLLSGRYVELHIFPLSFKEYSSAFAKRTVADNYRRYLEESSFPYAAQLNGDKTIIHDYLGGIYHTVLLKDVIEGNNIRDAARLERLIAYLADNIGSLGSIKKISDTMTSSGVKMLPLTIENYLDALIKSFIVYRASRYDVKGKKLLQTIDKYYLVDIGLRYFLLGSKKSDSGHILENVVYLELLRRGLKVYVGKSGDKEIDFIAEGPDNTAYFQVADTVSDPAVLKRELEPLEDVRDHSPKFLLTKDFEPKTSHNGIRQLNVFDWLLE